MCNICHFHPAPHSFDDTDKSSPTTCVSWCDAAFEPELAELDDVALLHLDVSDCLGDIRDDTLTGSHLRLQPARAGHVVSVHVGVH